MNNQSKPTHAVVSEDDGDHNENHPLSETEALAMLQRVFAVTVILAKAQAVQSDA